MSVNHLAVDTIEYLQLKPIELNRLALNNVELPNEPFSRGVLSELSEFLYGQNYRFFEVYIRIDRLFTPYPPFLSLGLLCFNVSLCFYVPLHTREYVYLM